MRVSTVVEMNEYLEYKDSVSVKIYCTLLIKKKIKLVILFCQNLKSGTKCDVYVISKFASALL